MADRCEAVWFGRERCERDAEHLGPHMAGLAPGVNLVHAWSMSKDGDKPDKPIDGTPVKNPPPMKPLPRPLPPAPKPGGKQI